MVVINMSIKMFNVHINVSITHVLDQNFSMIRSLYDNKLATLPNHIFAPLQALATLWVQSVFRASNTIIHIISQSPSSQASPSSSIFIVSKTFHLRHLYLTHLYLRHLYLTHLYLKHHHPWHFISDISERTPGSARANYSVLWQYFLSIATWLPLAPHVTCLICELFSLAHNSYLNWHGKELSNLLHSLISIERRSISTKDNQEVWLASSK